LGLCTAKSPQILKTAAGALPPESKVRNIMDDAGNHEIYDVNTIANYDPDVIFFLEAPIGSAFERDQTSGIFVSVPFEPLD
jgi:hypothetical protein